MYAKTRARGACIGPVLRDPAPSFRAVVRVPVTTRSWGLGPRVSIPLGIGAAWVTVFGRIKLITESSFFGGIDLYLRFTFLTLVMEIVWV